MLEHSLVHLECLVFWYIFQAVWVLLAFKQFLSVTQGAAVICQPEISRGRNGVLVSGTAAKIVWKCTGESMQKMWLRVGNICPKLFRAVWSICEEAVTFLLRLWGQWLWCETDWVVFHYHEHNIIPFLSMKPVYLNSALQCDQFWCFTLISKNVCCTS